MAAQITALPTPPTRQDPTNFNDRADAFLAALPGFQSEANALSTEVNTRADNVQASDLAVLAATNITKWVSGTTYAQGAVVWSPINGLGYRRITASGSGTTDPSSDSTNYRQVNGTGNVSTDTNNNIGLGTTPSAWGSGYKTVDINTYGAITSNAGNSLFLAGNVFFNGTNWVYKTNHGNGAHLFGLNPTGFGGFSWSIAPSGTAGNTVSFTQAMTLDASGNLGVGDTSPATSGFGKTLSINSGTSDYGALKLIAYKGSNLSWFSSFNGYRIGEIAVDSSSGSSPFMVFRATVSGTTVTESARIDSSGNLLVGTTSGSGLHAITKSGAEITPILQVLSSTTGYNSAIFLAVNAQGWNAAGTAIYVGKNTSTNRSISTGGTVNASGADYAEYEYNNGLTISKGSVVGFKADGTLTLTYSEAVRFGVKSTDPSYVGGDTWGNEDKVGKRPANPAQDDEQTVKDKYAIDLAHWEASLEAARQKVDRIAYSGKVPVNVTGATPGGYIIAAQAEDGSIIGEFVIDPDFAQYKKTVGRVNKLLPDGRCEVAVIVH